MADMTKEVVVAACKSNGGYEAPLLNDQLFLHCRGFMAIQNLEPYENAKVLWLEQNAISELSGLEKQQLLVSLFVQNNTIRSLATFSAPLANLRVINVSHNYISSLEGLAEACPQLETLQCSHNRIACLKVCEGLWTLHKSLTSIDLSFNCIESYDPPQLTQPPSSAAIAGAADDIQVVGLSADTTTAPVMSVTGGVKSDPMTIVQFLKPMPLVSVVYLHGNAIIRGIKNYRRNLILHLPALTYVDERPIFTEERRVVEAWGRGGEAAEGEERLAIQREKKEHLNSCVRVLNEKMEANREIRDRLTQQWEAKRAEEFERLKVLRSEQKSERGREEHHEEEARRRIEKEEQDDWWDAEDAFAKEHQRLVETEKQHRHDFEQEEAVKQVTLEASRELTEEAQKPLPTNGPSTEWKELCRSDDDILYEMEMEIQHVLHSVDASVVASMHKAHPPVPAKAAHSDPEALENHDTSADSWMPPSRAVLKAERKVHAAVGETAQRLRADRESRESRWERFEQWSSRHATQK